jgi:hypothetical protein
MEQVLPRRAEWYMCGGGEVAQTMYTHISKCKNDKIKQRKKYMKLLKVKMKQIYTK